MNNRMSGVTVNAPQGSFRVKFVSQGENMRTRGTQTCHATSSVVDKDTRLTQFAHLRTVLACIKSRPPNGELATVLEMMLDAGQIECAPIRRRSREFAFRARVTPDEVRKLLPLAGHPLAQALLRFFLERCMAIPRLTGTEDKLPLLAVPGADFDHFPSGVEDPPHLGEAAKQWTAEEEVVEYLNVPFVRTVNGWIDLAIAERSVEIRWIREEDELLSYATIDDFKKDVVIVTVPKTPDEPVGLLGWIDRERFLRLHRTVKCSGDARACVFDLSKLLSMAVLKEAARQNAFPRHNS